MNGELIWRVFAGACSVARFLTKRRARRGTFLIVEDNADDAELLSHRVKKRGWHCEIAPSAEVAAGLVKHTFYPIAFVDMRLPGMSGAALVRLLSRHTPNSHIVVVCGDPTDLAEIPDGQFVCLMRKPATLEAIEDMLAKLKI